ncbi:hypothetical protein [Streptomyces sp. ST1015]|uniref:hypothetical protein n=1 Tax=unclassified Streptomyces TaxID=2593676 RepID=UPI001CA7907C|nr:hypothetical protein [Streptomyces sp. ST1015]QZZ30604.1 hypothetical protein A7X85_34165 [Streptomyces sp. ST1015]
MPEPGASPLPQTPPARSPLARAERFMWLNARVLEQRLFAHHFLGASADPAETALDAYRTADGGYGHALEPDLRGPVGQPPHAVYALRVLDALGRCGGRRVEQLCRHLTAVSSPDGALPAVLPSQRGYPAAPSAPIADAPAGDLLTTGPVTGLLHRNDVWHAWLFRATDFCWQAVESLRTPDPYEVQAAVAFLDSVPDRSRAQAAADRLGRLVRERHLAVLTPESPEACPAPAERHFPHDFAPVPHSVARAWFTDAEMSRSLDLLAAGQQSDGGWPPRRPRWTPSAALEARAMATIDALRTLRSYGRPLG